MEYADQLQKTLIRIADKYQLDLNNSRVQFHLETPGGQLLFLKRIDQSRLSFRFCYRDENGKVSKGIEVVLYTGLNRWAPLSTTLSSGERLVSAEIDSGARDFDVTNWEDYGYLNRGCRYSTREFEEIYLTSTQGAQVDIIPLDDTENSSEVTSPDQLIRTQRAV